MAKKGKLPTDPNKRAKSIVDLATGENGDNDKIQEGKNPAALALGRLGGLKGGNSRAAKLSPKKKSEIAKKAAKARWNK